MEQFKIGDVVLLKSGGPEMTIEEIGRWQESQVDQAKCSWFDENKKKSGIFVLESLEKPKY
jgi:uncharacterized protein YodC (DUF2158 family)